MNLTRDLGSILRPSQDKSLLVISIIRKRLGLNRIVGNFDGKSPFFLYERPSRAHVVNTGEALRPRKARQNLSKQTARSCFIGVMIANARSKEPRRAVGSARLRCTPRRCGAAGWHPAAAAGRQAARMQWFQAAPAHWRGSELLLYVSLAHGQQHRH